jgi:hypothetical protein
MRIDERLEQYRFRFGQWGSQTGDDFGSFRIPGPCGEDLLIIASPGDAHEGIPWEHVSVSTRHRVPYWKEMCFVKDLFWDEEDAVVQFHPPRSKYVNNCERCLHLWRPMNGEFPAPPEIAVGFKELGTLK